MFIGLFFIYFQFLPIDVETQPIFTLVFGVYLLLLNRARLKLSKGPKDSIAVLALIGVLTIYVPIGLLQGHSPLVDFAKYLVGPLTYLAFRNRTHLIRRNFVLLVLTGLCAWTVIQLIFPVVARVLYNTFFSRGAASIVADGTRGLAILTPEPSYFAFFSVILLVVLEFLRIQGKISDLLHTLGTSLIILLSVLTRSALVYMYVLILYLPYLYFSSGAVKLKITLAATFLFFLVSGFFSENRIFEVIHSFASADFSNTNIMDMLFFVDPSGGTRILLNLTGMSAIILKPFGFGIGQFGDTWLVTARHFNLPVEQNEVTSAFIGMKSVRAQAYFPNLVNDIGIFSCILLYVIFGNNRFSPHLSTRGLQCGILLVVLVMFFFQSQTTNPIPWILLAIQKDLGNIQPSVRQRLQHPLRSTNDRQKPKRQ